MKRVSLVLVGALIAASAPSVAAQSPRTLKFDIGPNKPEVSPIRDGYGRKKFLWGEQAGDWGFVRGSTYGCGSRKGVASGQYAAFNHDGQDVSWFTKRRDQSFDLYTAFLTPWYYDPFGGAIGASGCEYYGEPFSMAVIGYNDGQVVGARNVSLDSYQATKFVFDFIGVDSIAFKPAPNQAWFMMDNARIEPPLSTTAMGVGAAAVAPEPVSMVLLGTGLVGIGAVARRRRRREQESKLSRDADDGTMV